MSNEYREHRIWHCSFGMEGPQAGIFEECGRGHDREEYGCGWFIRAPQCDQPPSRLPRQQEANK